MAAYFNSAGSQSVTGTALQDYFYAFTRSTNLDDVLADSSIALLNWATGILQADGSYFTITAPNIQISQDLLNGAEKSDTLYGSNLSDLIVFNNGVVSGGFGSFSSIEIFNMGEGNDVVDLSAHGPGGVDFAFNTTIRGDGGDDTIIGGGGMDTIEGNAGNDFLVGWRKADTIDGGAGDDTIYGDDFGFNGIAGDDILRGGIGNDTIYGGGRADKLFGGADNDRLYGNLGDDKLYGEAGDDLLIGDDAGTSGNDLLDGGAGNDILDAGGGNDDLAGGTGDDVVDGGSGGDFVVGNSGNDTLIGGAGDDTIDGGADIDTARFSGARSDYSIVLNLDGSYTITDLRGGSPDGTDNVRNVEFFQFSDGTFAAGNLNNPPAITSEGGGDTASLTVAENATAVTTVTATDPDTGQTITYSIAGGADAALFQINPQTGALSFINAPDFEAPVDSDGNNVYEVIVRASDGNGGVDTQALSITVSNQADGSAPVISSNGGGSTASLTVDENGTAVTTVVATDPDGQTVTYAISGGADAALFTINPQTGALAFINAPDAEVPSDANGNGIYEVTVSASDGANVDYQALSVTVGNLNDNAPVITSNGGGAAAAISLAENIAAVATVAATDADGNALTYSIAGGADAALFQINPQTGALSFINAPDFEAPADADGNNVYEVIVRSSDGTLSDVQSVQVTITNANDSAPVISSNGGGASGAVNVQESSTAVTTVTASDADGSTVTYSITGGADAGLFTINPQTGALSFINPPDFEVPLDANGDGIYDVIVGASDGSQIDTQALAVTVTDVNENGRTLTGNSSNNSFSPTNSNLAFQTTALNDTVYGLDGADTIDGGGGADTMYGGTGNDIYFVDTFSDDGVASNDDQVVELAGEGVDTVNASVTYRMAAEVEKLVLTGAAAISGFGNALANTMTGNGAANDLSGEDGADILFGMAGNDRLYGGAGADSLDGGLGADRMEGGADDDTYVVDTYSDDGDDSNDDLVVELAGGGIDLVKASVSYRMAADVEKLTLTGTDAINGTGNALDNTINGNAASNILKGGDGNDILFGLGGDDFIYGEIGADRLEGAGGNDLLDGGVGNDTLLGGAGADTLIGGAGKDILTGGADPDTFVFGVNASALSSSSADSITDFATGVDKIDLPMLSGPVAVSAYVETTIATNSYTDALAAANGQMAAGVQAIFIAGSTNGWLFYDSNGDGTLDQSIILTGLNNLGAFGPNDLL